MEKQGLAPGSRVLSSELRAAQPGAKEIQVRVFIHDPTFCNTITMIKCHQESRETHCSHSTAALTVFFRNTVDLGALAHPDLPTHPSMRG